MVIGAPVRLTTVIVAASSPPESTDVPLTSRYAPALPSAITGIVDVDDDELVDEAVCASEPHAVMRRSPTSTAESLDNAERENRTRE